MEHIVQFAISMNDEAIKESVAKNAEKTITEALQKKVEKEIFRRRGWGNDSELTQWAEQIIVGYLDANKETIINEAARMLSDRLLRTKRVKEAVDGIMASAKEES